MSIRIETSVAQSDSGLPPQGMVEVIAWVHHSLPLPELQAVIQEVDCDVEAGRPPRVTTSCLAGQLIVAVYFRILPGNVATLGGLRVSPGHEQLGIRLLSTLTKQLAEEEGNFLVQAIVDKDNSSQRSLLAGSGYVRQTDVLQLWTDAAVVDPTVCELPAGYCWRPASAVSREELVELIGSTFVDTLDCPILNRLRSVDDVLSGFQDGRELSQLPLWFVLYRNTDKLNVGCLFLSQHSREVLEIAYLGLVPGARGLQLGTKLIGKARLAIKEMGTSLLVAGVDSENWPALRAYCQHGFQIHQSKSVYFRAADLQGNAVVSNEVSYQ